MQSPSRIFHEKSGLGRTKLVAKNLFHPLFPVRRQENVKRPQTADETPIPEYRHRLELPLKVR
jgi:hypothetical protein